MALLITIKSCIKNNIRPSVITFVTGDSYKPNFTHKGSYLYFIFMQNFSVLVARSLSLVKSDACMHASLGFVLAN